MVGKMASIRSSKSMSAQSINLKDLADGLEDQLLVVDPAFNIVFANLATEHQSPNSSVSPIGHKCYEIFESRNTPCSPPLWQCPHRNVIKNGKPVTIVHRYSSPSKSESDRCVKITLYPLRNPTGAIYAVAELRRDITAESELERQILRRHHQLRVLTNISNAITTSFDLDTILKIGLNNVLEIISGSIGGILLLNKDTNTLSYRVQHGLSAQYVEQMEMSIGDGIAGKVAHTGESILLEDVSRDPVTIRPDLVSNEGLQGFVSIPLKAKGKVVGVMNIASHIAGRFSKDDVLLLNTIGDYLGTAIEQAELYAGLARAGERYRALLHHALSAQEQERKRIAREIHDETSQAITSLTLSLQAIIGMAEMKGITDAELLERLSTTHSYAVYAGKEIVKLMKELRPTLLDELGLPAAIHRYAKDILQAKGINVSAEFSGVEQRLPPEIEVTLFRVAQGAIGNILEHSDAENAIIELNCNENSCEMRIEDDGKGFDVTKLTKVASDGRGAGVFTMKERVKLVDGCCHIESKQGHGSKVIVNVPISKDMADEED